VTGIRTSLSTASGVISQYEQVVWTLKDQVGDARSGLRNTFDSIAWGITLLVWLGLTQLGLLLQGLGLLGLLKAKETKAAATNTQPPKAAVAG
jgi:hypothetical protein